MAVHVDTRQAQATMREMARRLSSEQIKRATARAINHTTAKGKTSASQAILQRYGMKSAGIKKRLPIGKAYPRKLEGKVDASTRPTPLISFAGVRQNANGVSVAVVKGQRKVIRGAFIQTTKKGRRGVFARGKHNGTQFEFRHKRIAKSGPDMPIEELSALSMFGAGDSTPVQSVISTMVSTTYTQRLMHEMQQIANGVTR